MSNKIQKPCKICGKIFTPCADCEKDKTIFHWRSVACSSECARQYFTKIQESRQSKVKITEEYTVEAKNIETIDMISENTSITNDVKPKTKRTRKKSIKNEESEQID